MITRMRARPVEFVSSGLIKGKARKRKKWKCLSKMSKVGDILMYNF